MKPSAPREEVSLPPFTRSTAAADVYVLDHPPDLDIGWSAKAAPRYQAKLPTVQLRMTIGVWLLGGCPEPADEPSSTRQLYLSSTA